MMCVCKSACVNVCVFVRESMPVTYECKVPLCVSVTCVCLSDFVCLCVYVCDICVQVPLCVLECVSERLCVNVL